MLLRSAKIAVTLAAGRLGVSTYLLNSRWRRSRLLILCYHGVSLADEHEWSPGMYLSPAVFRSRLRRLQECRCTLLPLSDAVERLYEGNLPPRSVAITFDDGFFDFCQVAWPILQEFSFPATVYLTSYYSQHPWPVFDLMLSYLLWKASGRELDWPEVLPSPVRLDAAGRAETASRCHAHTVDAGLSGQQKDRFLSDLAARLEIDFTALHENRTLQLMNADEVRSVAAGGVDIQLHTHRHRLFPRRERFWREIDENREVVESLTHRNATHFCYPGGLTLPEFPGWLRERGITSATTCEIDIASPKSDPLLLPRVLDTSLRPEEFDAWISGFASLVPRRAVAPSASQLGVEPIVDG